jgi:hypothetical protein
VNFPARGIFALMPKHRALLISLKGMMEFCRDDLGGYT